MSTVFAKDNLNGLNVQFVQTNDDDDEGPIAPAPVQTNDDDEDLVVMGVQTNDDDDEGPIVPVQTNDDDEDMVPRPMSSNFGAGLLDRFLGSWNKLFSIFG